jgi:hypothetical protein
VSHFTRVKTEFKDADILMKALEDIGYKGKVERHENPVSLAGWGDGRGVDTRYGEIVIRKRHLRPAYSDLGFERKRDGKLTMWAESDFLARHPDFSTLLTQRYAYHATLTTLTKQGFAVADEVIEKSGEIRLVMRRNQ